MKTNEIYYRAQSLLRQTSPSRQWIFQWLFFLIIGAILAASWIAHTQHRAAFPLAISTSSLSPFNSSPNFQTQVHTLNALTDVRVTFTKSAAPVPAHAGMPLTYTLRISNSGAALHNVVLTDHLPYAVSLTNAPTDCTYFSTLHRIVCDVGDVPTATIHNLQLTARPWFTLENGTTITNRAALAYNESYTATQNAITVSSEISLTIAKTASSDRVQIGDYITYTILVTNTSGNPAPRTVLYDELPQELCWLSGGDVITGRNPEGCGGIITWSLGTLQPLSVTQRTIVVSMAKGLPDQYTIDNRVRVSSNGIENSAHGYVLVDAPLILAYKEDESTMPVAPGDVAEYALYLYNDGHAPATDVIVRDIMPPNTTLIPSWDVTETNGIITWTLDQLDLGSSGDWPRFIQLKIDNPLPQGIELITNSFMVTCAEGITAVSNVVTTPITVNPSLTVDLRAIPDGFVAPGEYITYQIFFTNSGNVALSNVIIETSVPDATALVTATSPFTLTGDMIRWTQDVIPGAPLPGFTGTVYLTVRVNKPISAGITRIFNEITVRSQAPTVHEEIFHHLKTHPKLYFTATNIPSGAIHTGEVITYSFAYTNAGDVEITSIILTSTVPTNTTFRDATGDYTVISDVVRWNIGALPGASLDGYTGTRQFRTQVDHPLALGTALAITACAQLNSASIITSHAVTLVNPITVQCALSLEISNLLNSTVGPGDQIHYRIHYTNTSDIGLPTVTITASIPENTALLNTDGNYHPVESLVTWNLGSIPAFPFSGSTGETLLDVRVDNPLAAAYFITTNALVNSLDGVDAQAQHTVAISATPDLRLDKVIGSVRGVDVVNVIDLSGSMAGEWGEKTKLAAAKEALIAFNNLLISGQGDQVGLVSFGATKVISGDNEFFWARRESSLTGDIGEVNEIINSFSPGFSTPLADGVRLGRETVLDSLYHRPRNQAVLIIASDGQADVGLDGRRIDYETAGLQAIDQAALAKDAGIIIFTIAIGEEFNAEVLQTMASAPTEEHFFTAATPEELNSIYEQIKQMTALDIVEPGDLISYTISYANVGNVGLADVRLRDYLPEHTSFIAASRPAATCYSGDSITKNTDCIEWQLGEVPAPNYADVITLTLRVDEPVPLDTRYLVNSAHIAGHLGGAPTQTVTTPLTLLPYLLFSKDAPTSIPQGGVITYTITLTNRSYRVLTDTLITDIVPAHTDFGGIAPPDDILTWTVAELAAEAPGDVVSASYAVRVDYPLTDGTIIANAYYGVTNSAALVVPRSGDITTYVAAPRFSIHKRAAPAPWIQEGELLTYTITIANRGQWTTTQPFTVTDILPQHTSLVTAPRAIVVGTEIRWHITAPLTPDSSYVISYTAQVNTPLTASTPIVNDSCRLNSPEIAAPVRCPPITVTVGAGYLLTLTKDVYPPEAHPGEHLTYTLNYAVLGNQIAPDVVLTDSIPPHTELITASLPYSIAGHDILWDLGDVPFGKYKELTLSVRLTGTLLNGTLITNAARIADSTGLSATAVATSVVRAAYGLQLEKRGEPEMVKPGDTVTYILNYTVAGAGIAPDVRITDKIPSGTEFITAAAGVSFSDGVLSRQLGDVTAPTRGAITFSVRVSTENMILNTAHIFSADGVSTTAIATNAVLLPDLAIWKTVSPAMAEAGEIVTYTLYYQNLCADRAAGCVEARNVVITDDYAAPLMILRDVPGGIIERETIRWEIGELAVDAGGRITYTARITPTLPYGVTEIENRAAITCAVRDAHNANNTSDASVVVTAPQHQTAIYLPAVLKNYASQPDLFITELGIDPASLVVGQPVTITVRIENRGAMPVNSPFWVDLYIDPAIAHSPPRVNETWADAGCPQGIAWLVSALPIPPGGAITLTSHSYAAAWSSWVGNFTSAEEHVIYAQVDSYNGTVPYGGVLESDETNNVWGPHAVQVRGFGISGGQGKIYH